MTYNLRPYQKTAVKAGLDYIDGKSTKPSLIVAPVGSGKSLLIANIADQIIEPVINLQPTKELLQQNYSKFISYGNKASIFSASLGKKNLGHITFATPRSIITEAEYIRDVLGTKVVIIDEAHYETKKTSVIQKFLDTIKADKVIGLTATPVENRSYGGESYLAMINRSRKNLFSDRIHVTQVSEVKDYWAKMDYQQRYVDRSKLRLNTTGTDYTNDSMKEFYSFNELKSKVIKEIEALQTQGKKSILVFVPSIYEATTLANLIPNAETIHSKMGGNDRERVVNGFKNLQIPVVVNVNIFGMGFDHPTLDAIITARPTNSFTIHYQQLGRGVRPHPNKKDCTIVDFSGNLVKFGELSNIEFLHEENRWGMFVNGEQYTNGTVFKNQQKSDNEKIDLKNWDGRIWFGEKYKGYKVSKLPTFYLSWIAKEFKAYNQKGKALIQMAKNELEYRTPIKTFKN